MHLCQHFGSLTVKWLFIVCSQVHCKDSCSTLICYTFPQSFFFSLAAVTLPLSWTGAWEGGWVRVVSARQCIPQPLTYLKLLLVLEMTHKLTYNRDMRHVQAATSSSHHSAHAHCNLSPLQNAPPVEMLPGAECSPHADAPRVECSPVHADAPRAQSSHVQNAPRAECSPV